MYRRFALVAAMVVGLATITAPVVAAAKPQPITIVSTMTPLVYPAGYNSGTFSATGSDLICASGTVLDTRYVGGPIPNGYRLLVDKTFTCDDLTGTIFFRLQVRGSSAGVETFHWVILGGTGAYAHLHGHGVGSTVRFTDGATNTYTGSLHH